MSPRPEAAAARAYEVVVWEGLSFCTPDGIELVADAYLPACNGSVVDTKFPTLLERTPYGRKLEPIPALAREAVSRGYVFVVQDVRGRGDSGGRFMFMMNDHDEGSDGESTVEWLRTQHWWNGSFATVGGSFSSANSTALAIRRPSGLVAQVQRDSGTNYYRWMYRNHGLALVGVLLPWAIKQGIISHEAQRDPAVRTAFERMNNEIDAFVPKLPIQRGKTDLSLAPDYEALLFDVIENGDDGEYWQHPIMRLEDHWDEYPEEVAVLLVSGWFAHHAAANLEKFRQFSSRTSAPVRLVMGPWIHSHYMGELTTAGDVDFGMEASRHGPVARLWLDFLDETVRGAPPTTRTSSVRYFVMGTGDGHRTPEGKLFYGGHWRESDTWPPVGTETVPFHFHLDGTLSRVGETSTDVAVYDYDPADPCPGIGSTNLQSDEHPGFVLPGPWDQRNRTDFAASRGSKDPLTNRADVVSFSTEPLSHSIEIAGEITARVFFSTSAADTDVVLKLVDVHPPSTDYPEGYALLLTEGMVRLRYRSGSGHAEPTVPGQVYELEIELTPTCTVIKAGHQLRLDITSSHFPAYDVNPNTGEPLGHHTHEVIASQRLHLGPQTPSQVLLPVRQGMGAQG